MVDGAIRGVGGAAAGRPLVTRAVTRGAARVLGDLGFAVLAEAPLAGGLRADLLGLGPRGELVIVEVKSCAADYRGDGKWTGYLDHCDVFYFAVPEAFPLDLAPPQPGLIVADGFGGAVVRPPAALPVAAPMAAARRKALTLAFARLAAQRLATGRAV